jgi:hypothetical protein
MKLFFTAFTILFLSTATPTYAQNTFCNRVGNQMVCGPERFEYFPVGKNDKKWCITMSMPYGTPDLISCRFDTKNACIDDNPGRELIKSRCVKNPAFNDDNE